jgi:hypothetical protein
MSNTFTVLVAESASISSNTLSPNRNANGRVAEIAVGKLQESIKSLCENMSEVLKDAQQVGNFELTEVKLQVEISAEGNLVLIGKAGVKGAISLTFAPKESA